MAQGPLHPHRPAPHARQPEDLLARPVQVQLLCTGISRSFLPDHSQRALVSAAVKGRRAGGSKAGVAFKSTNPKQVSVVTPLLEDYYTAHVRVGSATIIVSPAHTIKETLPAAVDVVVAPPSAGTQIIQSPEVISASPTGSTLVADRSTLAIRLVIASSAVRKAASSGQVSSVAGSATRSA